MLHFFINFRYGKSYLEASKLKTVLEKSFGDKVEVFFDEDKIQAGDSLKKEIFDSLEKTDYVLSLLHEKWLFEPKIPGKEVNKLRDPKCWVRQELLFAQEKGKIIIPICLGEAKLPSEEELYFLPDELHFLSNDTLAINVPPGDNEAGWDHVVAELKRKIALDEQIPVDPLQKRKLVFDFPLPSIEDTAPYLGIHYFKAEHAGLFFGRDIDIVALWDKLQNKSKRLVLLYGYSGVGKSSLLHAGLYPRLERKGWTVRAERRQRHRSLSDLLTELTAAPMGKTQTLVAIDQVEEAITDPMPLDPDGKPNDWKSELADFFALITKRLKENPELFILIGFRKEFLAEVSRSLSSTQPHEKHFLEPLNEAGMRQAIELNETVRQHYSFEFGGNVPAQILQKMTEADTQAQDVSVMAPWLQIVLLELWKEAQKNYQASRDCMLLDTRHFEAVWKYNFPQQINAQLEQLRNLPAPHSEYLDNGLTLELLYELTTSSGTAAVVPQEDLTQKFAQPELAEHLRHMDKLRLVADVQAHPSQPHRWRLTHNALAPVIRAKHEKSDASVQRANRIFASKALRNPAGEVIDYRPVDSPYEHAELDKAKPFMAQWKPEQETAFNEGFRLMEIMKAERKNFENIFRSILNIGKEHLEHCKHVEALGRLLEALEVPVAAELKTEKLYPAFEELLYFFVEADRFFPEVRQAAEALLRLAPGASLQILLRQCLEQNSLTRTQCTPLLQNLRTYATLKKRYYPTMIRVEGGTFTMGDGSFKDNPAHEARVDTFEIGETPVTFYQYSLYCAATGRDVGVNSLGWGIGGDNPVVQITWYDTLDYCNWSSEREYHNVCYNIVRILDSDTNNKTDDQFKWKVDWEVKAPGYRLPTEAEWEYAAKGGLLRENFRYAGSDQLENVGWYWLNSGKEQVPDDGREWDLNFVQLKRCRTHPVRGISAFTGQQCQQPNGLGLYDMSGNVFEWCWDWYDSAYYDSVTGIIENPKGALTSIKGRVVRGGSWFDVSLYSQVVSRNCYKPDLNYFTIGFRLLRALPS